MTFADTIGVVGGMGPYAGLQLVQNIFNNTVARGDQDHLNVILMSASDIPDRTGFLLGNIRENPAHRITDVLSRLAHAGAVVAGIPCNTAHAGPILKVVREEMKMRGIGVKLVNMIDETMAVLRSANRSRVGVLATTGTIKAGVYVEALRNAGMDYVQPDDETQERVHQIIYDPDRGIKARSRPVTEWAVEEINLAITHLLSRNADIIVLGCTELPLAVDRPEVQGIPIVDPAVVLARALIRSVAPEKLKSVDPDVTPS